MAEVALEAPGGVEIALLDYPATCVRLRLRTDSDSTSRTLLGEAIATVVRAVDSACDAHNVALLPASATSASAASAASASPPMLTAYIFARDAERSATTNPNHKLGASEMMGRFGSQSEDELHALQQPGAMAAALAEVSAPSEAVWAAVKASTVELTDASTDRFGDDDAKAEVEAAGRAAQQTSADPVSASLIVEARATDPFITEFRARGGRFERRRVTYAVDGTEFEGFSVVGLGPNEAMDEEGKGEVSRSEGSPNQRTMKPGVLIVHTAVGVHDDFMELCAEQVAAMGYVAFVGDMYGKEKARAAWQQAGALMAANRADGKRATVQGARVEGALRALQSLPGVDPESVAAIGFCYGGQCVTDLAKRVGVREGLRAWVSVHGTVGRTEGGASPLRVAEGDVAPGLVLHGVDDPFVPPSNIAAFLEEFSVLADVELVSYQGTTHAFSRPDKVPGDEKMRYSPGVARRAWTSIERALADAFDVS